ncbi:MAG: hypothetical protein AB1779_07330 [Candidatus Thermoplasmatota archaeon]
MKTCVRIIFNSEGCSPNELANLMREVGFSTSFGEYDFVYDWGKKEVSVENVINFLERIHKKLKGKNVLYEVTTVL